MQYSLAPFALLLSLFSISFVDSDRKESTVDCTDVSIYESVEQSEIQVVETVDLVFDQPHQFEGYLEFRRRRRNFRAKMNLLSTRRDATISHEIIALFGVDRVERGRDWQILVF